MQFFLTKNMDNIYIYATTIALHRVMENSQVGDWLKELQCLYVVIHRVSRTKLDIRLSR